MMYYSQTWICGHLY